MANCSMDDKDRCVSVSLPHSHVFDTANIVYISDTVQATSCINNSVILQLSYVISKQLPKIGLYCKAPAFLNMSVYTRHL